MKNKGFTLIELLSVIVVIAIVTLIAFPVISGVVEKTKLKALEDSAYGLVEASNLYYAQYQNNETKRFDKNDEENTLKNLSYKGSIEKGTVIINNKGQVTVCISDGKNSAYKNYNENKVTAVAKKTCTIPSNTYIVYLDDERTVKTYTTEELTEIVEELKSEVATLKEENNNVINEIYPVGSIYMSTTDDTVEKVQARFGGTWEVYGDGKMIKSSTETAGSTGGSNSVTLSASNIPNHIHTIPILSNQDWTGGSHTHHATVYHTTSGVASNGLTGLWISGGSSVATTYGTSENFSLSTINISAGSLKTNSSTTTTCNSCAGQSFSVQNEYITVYMYKRVA